MDTAAVAALKRDVDTLNTTVYVGNGRPGLVTRMDAVEQRQAWMTKLAWLLLGSAFTLLATAGAMIVAAHVH
jgi:hypothetical protein